VERTVLRAPPELERAEAGGALLAVLPALGSLGSVALVATAAGGPRQHLGIAVLVGVTVLVAAAQVERQRRQRSRSRDDARADYLAHLADVRAETRRAAVAQRVAATIRHPPPRALAALLETGSWRTGEDGRVRYGVVEGALDDPLRLPDIGARADPFCADAVRRLLDAHATWPGMPATLDLRETDEVAAPAGTARALVCAAVGCPDVALAVLADTDALPSWEWTKWLPRAESAAAHDGVGPARMVAGSYAELATLLPERGHLLLVLDGVPAPTLDRPATLLRVADRLTADGTGLPGTPDDCPVEVAEAFARRCAGGGAVAFPHGPEWSARPAADQLRVPVGRTEDGTEVMLDLKETALGGSGPHGMVIGATGSGKSELLRALVLRLALTHPPSRLHLVLVDFKGGAAFDGLARLPHVSALVTNLADELDLLDRTADALTSELTRRQELLRANGGDRRSLPTLLVVVDELAELLAARPELDELLVTMGRLGRGLGIHLLLASQRLDEGRWRGLESHLSYRIALRTFTAEESRAVLGSADAYELPAVPGLGYLRTDPRTVLRLRAPYVGTTVRQGTDPVAVLPFTAAPVPGPPARSVPLVEAAVEATVRATDAAPELGRAHPIWLPPLDRSATLGDLLPDLGIDPARGFGQRSATVPLGEVDRPLLQRRDRLEIDLTGGHVAIAGAAGSGRSGLLRTAVAGLALTRTPEEVAVLLLDPGGALGALAGLPHVAGRAGRDQLDLAMRIVEGLTRGTDRPTVLVVDDWGLLRGLRPDLEEAIVRLVTDGGRGRVHLLTTTGRWSQLPATVRDALGTRIELRLGDPLDSEVDRRLAAAVPHGRPGRGLVDGAHFLAALASISPQVDHDAALADLVARVDAHWHGPLPRRLRDLPGLVHLDGLREDPGIRLGLRDGDHALQVLPESGHLTVLGDAGSGRTALLRTLVAEVARTRPTAQVLVVDPRGTLRDEVAPERLLAHLDRDPSAGLTELATQLARRLDTGSGPDPEVWVIADDVDLLEPSVWQPLVRLLPRAGDLGLRVVVARRTGGAARALYEPLLGTLREVRTPTVLLSGSPEEGPLASGVRARQAPAGRAVWVAGSGFTETFQSAWGGR
jgi:DNA segregation ATPase FtsK/SpoIIIE, S-DNA-T family